MIEKTDDLGLNYGTADRAALRAYLFHNLMTAVTSTTAQWNSVVTTHESNTVRTTTAAEAGDVVLINDISDNRDASLAVSPASHYMVLTNV